MRREVMIHIPLPYYSSDQLVRTLFAHRKFHNRRGTFVPQPKLYQNIARHCLKEEPSKQNFSFLRRSLLSGLPHGTRRIFLSFAGLPNSPLEIVSEEGILPDLSVLVGRISYIFHDCDISIFVGIVNQGKLVSSLIQSNATIRASLETAASAPSIYWSDAIGACKDEYKRVRFVVWRHEESVGLWPNIIRCAARIPESVIPPGTFDMLVQKLNDEGIKHLRSLLSRTSKLSEDQVKKIIITFLESKRFSRNLRTQIRIDGWTRDVISHFDEIYEDDVRQIYLDRDILLLGENITTREKMERYRG